MSQTTYYLAWLAAGLLAAAIASALIARRVRTRLLRRAMAAKLCAALAGYSAWLAAQQHATFSQGDAQGGDCALEEVRAIQRQWFPELAGEAAHLSEAHALVIGFLWKQQVLRLRDAEAWLESDHDARFVQLWRMHRDAVLATGDKLRLVPGLADADDLDAGAIFPA